MSKHLSLLAAVSIATLTALPAVSEASDCLRLHRLGTRAVGVADDAGRVVTRVGDGIVRVGERAFGWIFCDRHRV